MSNHLLDPHEAAEVLKMDSRTLVRWARTGYVPAHPLGGGKRKLWRFVEHELLDWVEAQGKAGERRPVASVPSESIDVEPRKTA
jgi:excisionase family DNA binding protein